MPEETKPAAGAEGTAAAAQGSGASGSATKPEAGFAGIDPASLAPELQTVYKSMQADYTKKTQAVAEQSKSVQAVEAEFKKRGLDPSRVGEVLDYAIQLDQYVRGKGAEAKDAKSAEPVRAKGTDAKLAELLVDEDTKRFVESAVEARLTESTKAHEAQLKQVGEYYMQLLNLAVESVRLEGSDPHAKGDPEFLQKVIKNAQKIGTTDLRHAAKDLYLEQEIEERVKAEVDKAQEKWKADEEKRKMEVETSFVSSFGGPAERLGAGEGGVTLGLQPRTYESAKRAALPKVIKEVGIAAFSPAGSSAKIHQ